MLLGLHMENPSQTRSSPMGPVSTIPLFIVRLSILNVITPFKMSWSPKANAIYTITLISISLCFSPSSFQVEHLDHLLVITMHHDHLHCSTLGMYEPYLVYTHLAQRLVVRFHQLAKIKLGTFNFLDARGQALGQAVVWVVVAPWMDVYSGRSSEMKAPFRPIVQSSET
jgi:hypothetical protein